MFSRTSIIMLFIFLMVLILSGCMYPKEKYAENQIPPENLVRDVQHAIDLFYEENKILPIKTQPAETPVYEKYIIQFNRIVPQYLTTTPPNVFEKGGNYYYVLVDVEEKPTVKLLDLRIASKVADLQQKVNVYIKATGKLPALEKVDETEYYTIDFKALKIDPQFVRSVYSGEFLPLVMNGSGTVGVDYRLDLMKQLENKSVHVKENEDIRYLLTDNSFFVPVKSFPYTLQNGEAVFLTKK